jgi:hypothetical protein
MADMKRIAGVYVAWLVAAGLLVYAAVERHPYSFYTLLRWICCPVFAYSAFAAYEKNRVLWVWVFGVLAALYNPVFRVELDRSTWIVVNWLTVGAILIAIGFFWASESKIVQQAAPKDGEALRDGLTQAEQAELKQLGSIPQLTEIQDMRVRFLHTKRDQAKAKASNRNRLIGLVIAVLVCFFFSIVDVIDDYELHAKGDAPVHGQFIFFNAWTFFGILLLFELIRAIREQRKKSRVAVYDEQAARAAYDRYRRSMERQGRIKPKN